MFSEHTVLLHDLQELHNHLRARADEDLALAGLLGVVDGVERIVEDGCLDHGCGNLRFSRRGRGVRYLHCSGISLQEPFERKECRSVREGFFGSVEVGIAVSLPSLTMSAGRGYLKNIARSL